MSLRQIHSPFFVAVACCFLPGTPSLRYGVPGQTSPNAVVSVRTPIYEPQRVLAIFYDEYMPRYKFLEKNNNLDFN